MDQIFNTILFPIVGVLDAPCLTLRNNHSPDWYNGGNVKSCAGENHETSNNNFPTNPVRRSICTFCLAQVRKPSQQKTKEISNQFCSTNNKQSHHQQQVHFYVALQSKKYKIFVL